MLLSAVLFSCAEHLHDELDYQLQESVTVRLLSGKTAYLFSGDTARVTISTVPWNFPAYSDKSIVLTDTFGLKTDKCEIVGKVLLPDSTWQMSLVLKKSSSTWVCICADWSDTLFRSEPFNVKSISTTPSINIGGEKVPLSNNKNNYELVLPTVTDFSNLKMSMIYSGDSATFNGKRIKELVNELDFSKPAILTLWQYGACKSYCLSVRNTGLPIVRVSTPKKKDITSKEVWMSGCTMRIELSDGTVDYEDTLSVRGRGNASWTDTEKKSYALKMDEKGKVLGMPKHKRWILLANFKDRTLMRNDVTFWLARHTSQDYVISGQFVELEVNGKYRGNYYLCEQGKIGKHRIDINAPDPDNPGISGFLLESDAYFIEERNKGLVSEYGGFISSYLGVPYAFKQLDEETITKETFEKVRKYINDFEACIKNESRVKKHEYEKYLDVDQCIDYAIIQELTGNLDFYNSYPVNGTHSMYFHFDSIDYGGKLVFGHLWDFDYMTYDPNRANGWVGITKHGSNQEFYYYYLFKDYRFTNRFRERWNLMKNKFLEATEYIDQTANLIRLSERCNATLPVKSNGQKGWIPIQHSGGHNNDENMSFQDAVNSMKKGLVDRWNWMDKAINSSSFPNN